MLSKNLRKEFRKQLKTEILIDFSNFDQSISPTSLTLDETTSHNTRLILQGSCADGNIILGRNKSDIDFIYLMNEDLTFLQFDDIFCNCKDPAYVNLKVIIKSCSTLTRFQQKTLKKINNCGLEKCFLDVQTIRQLITNNVNKRVRHQYTGLEVILPDNNSCFRIPFEYKTINVILNYLEDQRILLMNFIYDVLHLDNINEAVEKLLLNTSGRYYLSKKGWKEFQLDLASPEYNINFLVEKYFCKMTYQIMDQVDQAKDFNCYNISFENIVEAMFLLLLSILIFCGFDTIWNVILKKNLSFLFSNRDGQNNEQDYGKIIFTNEEIREIVSIEVPLIFEAITGQNKLINTICTALKDFEKNLKVKVDFSTDNYIDYDSNIQIYLLVKLTSRSLFATIMKFTYLSDQCLKNELESHTIEVIPALTFDFWPSVAEEWKTRKRKWPSPEIVQEIINHGFHLVFKSCKVNAEYDGRLSFSSAEKIMCEAMSHEQKVVLYFVKDKFKNLRFSRKHLKSYFIKSIAFWVFEKRKSVNRNSDQLKKKYLKDIIKLFVRSLKKHRLSNYFIPNHNLFIELSPLDWIQLDKAIRNYISEGKNTVYRSVNQNQKAFKNVKYDVEMFFHYAENRFYRMFPQILGNIFTE